MSYSRQLAGLPYGTQSKALWYRTCSNASYFPSSIIAIIIPHSGFLFIRRVKALALKAHASNSKALLQRLPTVAVKSRRLLHPVEDILLVVVLTLIAVRRHLVSFVKYNLLQRQVFQASP